MSDVELRILRRAAATGGPEEAARLARARARARWLDEELSAFVARLTPEGALWIGGMGFVAWHGMRALGEHLIQARWPEREAQRLAYDPAVHAQLLRRCVRRARAEWDAIAAIAVLRDRRRIRRVLGLARMPDGTRAEERRLRVAWLERVGLGDFLDHPRIRHIHQPPKMPPFEMGWESLLEDDWQRRQELRP